MIEKILKIRKKDIPLILKKGKIATTPLFILRFMETKEPAPARFLVVISKKTAARATDRNTIKRRVYSIVRELPRVSGALILIFPKTAVLKASYQEIKNDLRGLFEKMGI